MREQDLHDRGLVRSAERWEIGCWSGRNNLGIKEGSRPVEYQYGTRDSSWRDLLCYGSKSSAVIAGTAMRRCRAVNDAREVTAQWGMKHPKRRLDAGGGAEWQAATTTGS